MQRFAIAGLWSFFLLLLLSGCQADPKTTDSENKSAAEEPVATEPAVGIEVAEAKAQVMEGMEHGVVYLSVTNHSAQADRLVSVETTAAVGAETHESMEDDGMVRMVARPEGFEIPAGGTLRLEPGGKHIMLLQPHGEAADKETLPLTLHFERAGAIEVEAARVAMGGDHSGMDHSDMDHSGMDHSASGESGTQH